MAKKKKSGAKTRAEPRGGGRTGASWLCSPEAYETLCVQGYTSLAQNPEVVTGVDRIARLISSMTIQLMRNTERGDVRERNELSKKLDIHPNARMTRSSFIHWIVKTLLLEGNGNAVVLPQYGYRQGRYWIDDLTPIPPGMVSFLPDGPSDYRVAVGGQEYSPDDVLHFVANPDPTYPWKGDGYRVALRDVADNLKQGAATERGFMASQWKPSLIVKVDALTDEFASPEGRRRLLEEYVGTGQAGEPWMIPAGQLEVQEVRPLSLSDLALSDMVQLDKRTVAAILGVPPFVLGVGDYSKDAWNNFISATIMPLAKSIEQELTRKLLVSPDRYFRFNSRSLYSYDIAELSGVAVSLFEHGMMTGNEARGWLDMPPLEGLDDLLILENYIPVAKSGDQNKLNGGNNP